MLRWMTRSGGLLAKRRVKRLLTGPLATVGGVLQCAAINPGMLVSAGNTSTSCKRRIADKGLQTAGRLMAGIACGQDLSVVPIYLAEASPQSARGFLVDLQGMMTAIGFLSRT